MWEVTCGWLQAQQGVHANMHTAAFVLQDVMYTLLNVLLEFVGGVVQDVVCGV